MNKRCVMLAALFLLTGCGAEPAKQSAYDVEQRRLIEQQNASKEAAVQHEQEELARVREQRRKRDEAAQLIAQSEIPVIRPLEPSPVEPDKLENSEKRAADLDNLPLQRAIYYDYDSYNVKEEYRQVLEAHSRYLLAHREVKLRIEGNCDERGSREYNLALGQRRADSIKRALALIGVPAGQIEAVSFGSEKPKATTRDEQGYAENRRSDLTYAGSKSASK